MSKMKYSGVEWIGDIPIDWKVNRLRYNCTFKTGGTPPDKYGINIDVDGYPWITAQDMNNGMIIKNYSQYITEESRKYCSYKLFPKDTILLVCIASVGKIGYLLEPAYSNQQITALMPNKNIFAKYLLYLIAVNSPTIIKDASSNVVPIINTQYLANIYCCLPNINEQKLIANFLDEKISNLDNILLDLNKQIDILDRYKKQLITETIKSGLEKNVNYVDSNKEWIGQINSTAKLIRLKNYSYLKGRIGWQGLTADEFIDEGPYCVTGTDFINGKINWQTCYHISEKRYEMDYNIHLKVGDLLVTKDGTIGKLAKVNFLPDRACLNSHLLIIRPLTNDYTNEYLFYVMSSDIFKEYAKILANGSTMDSLSQEKIGNFIFPSYELKKQNEIVKYLDNKCSQIAKIIEEKQKQIEKIEEYKKSVIYEYVTGKKRVEGAEELYG